MENCANCKCETPSTYWGYYKKGRKIYHGELTLLLLRLGSLKDCFFIVSYYNDI